MVYITQFRPTEKSTSKEPTYTISQKKKKGFDSVSIPAKVFNYILANFTVKTVKETDEIRIYQIIAT